MAEPNKPQRVVRVSQIPEAQVHVTADKRLQIEFRIDDLVKKLIPGGIGPVANCGGCHGCMGCSM